VTPESKLPLNRVKKSAIRVLAMAEGSVARDAETPNVIAAGRA
jgi:hypothetical protein